MGQIFNSPFNIAFGMVMLIIFFGAFKLEALKKNASSFLVSIGILGTFFGIFLGLLSFDVTNIEKSVPNLLEGLKTAFFTSILGMVFSLVLKIFQSFRHESEEDNEDVLDVLNHIKNLSSDNIASINSLKLAITGDSDGSLVTQIQKLRSEATDNFKDISKINTSGFEKIQTEFKNFADKVADNNSKALIDALKEVIRDFNSKINEQFGDNFKQLNEAVSKLLIWQENYKEHINILQKQFELAISGIEKSKNSIEAIKDSSSQIPTAMEKLSYLITSQIDLTDEASKHLEAFQHLKSQAQEAMPIIENNLVLLTDNIQNAVYDVSSQLKESVESFNKNNIDNRETYNKMANEFYSYCLEIIKQLESHSESHLKLTENTKETIGILTKELENCLKNYSEKLVYLLESNMDSTQKSALQIQKGIEAQINSNIDTLGKQINALDEQMQEEVSRVVNVMGSKLASLSNKFVEDYTPLTDKLQKVVRLADNVTFRS